MKKSKVFDYFRKLTDNDRDKYVCLFCDAIYMCRNATRFARHIVFSCKNSPVEVKRDLEPQKLDKAAPNQNNSTSSEELIEENSESEIFNEKEVHKALARAVYVTGQPLSIFEHPLWKQALQLLKPDFNPPSRKMLSTVLLEEEYEDVKQKVTEKIKDANVLHLAADGWTNVRKDSIINIIIYTPKPYFHSSIDTQNNRHTAEYMSERISQTMDEIGSSKFLGIITDNAANMKKCGKLLTDQYENTTWVGCLAHTLNLLIGDVLKIDTVQETFKSVIAIVKSVLQSNINNAEF
ncbi:zinc finger BED domain-containing protein 4-like [Leguminivora glycinivorella]|uniref:zinc finger BED domain-containing protein 4-like n=1 Tax=Leguminivora glycinivorella TaxID=1035111 RepID=UPI00200E9735|nr:zinc finger BED domain-containing protein 4-like [Leguminivora glycinivorella]